MRDNFYCIELPLQYQVIPNGSSNGCGHTLEMNSKCIRFASDQDLNERLMLRVIISWPARLPDGTCLSLWIYGQVEHSVCGEVELNFSRYEFRTRRAEGPLAEKAFAHAT